jgi:hypothetical protein
MLGNKFFFHGACRLLFHMKSPTREQILSNSLSSCCLDDAPVLKESARGIGGNYFVPQLSIRK